MIPKIIHYCWLSGDDIPDALNNCMKSWKEKLPDYEFMLWDGNRFDINSSIWVKQAFENKKYAFAADYIRLYAVYNLGGIYMDMDIEVIKNFDDFLERDLVIAYENEQKRGIEAGCFGAKPFHPIIKKCLDYYDGRKFIKKSGSFDIRPLPQIMNSVIKSSHEKIGIFSCDFFTAKSYETGKITITENTHTIHHFAGSWLSDEQKEISNLCRSVYEKIPVKFLVPFFVIPVIVLWRMKKYGLGKSVEYYFNKFILHSY